MKLLCVALAASTFALTGCRTAPENMNNHWRLSNVPDRLNYHFVNGYDAHYDGGAREHMGRGWESVKTTLVRHLLSVNPDNPLGYSYSADEDEDEVEEILEQAEELEAQEEREAREDPARS